MKLMGNAAAVILALILIAPIDVAAQERIAPFDRGHVSWEAKYLQIGPSPSDYHSTVAAETRSSGLLLGALIGAVAGTGIGYVISKDSTAGCDDGLCGWVLPTMVGGVTGLVIGGWFGYRIGLGVSGN